ncbi:MAG: HNH endonuclease [Armatimonadetes bacterium]|nr:HNH endonuclease [Armatimonadota bacterium]
MPSSRHIRADLQRLVVRRAGGRCKYCGMAQEGQEAAFHVDHVIPVALHGPTEPANLALVCVSCSLRKGARRRAWDPDTRELVPLYNPRRARWGEHFTYSGGHIVGRTPIGRATAQALEMNRPTAVAIRREQSQLGWRWPLRNEGP